MFFSVFKNFFQKQPTSAYSIAGRKPAQEDAFFISPVIQHKRLILVADGVGGHSHGEYASNKTIEIFRQEFKKLKDQDINHFLKKTALLAAGNILNKAAQQPEYKNSGSTLTGFLIDENVFYSINIGDSRVYHFSDGRLCQVTNDHSVVQKLLDANLITSREAKNHPERHVMTSAIGQPIDKMDIQLPGKKKLNKGDILIACSDGVHDVLNDYEILELILNSKRTKNISKQIVTKAYEAGSEDNITTCTYQH